MGKIYKYHDIWLKKKDNLGRSYSAWCKKISDIEVLCTICDKTIVFERKGLAALTQHAGTSLHSENAHVKLNESQLLLKRCQPENNKDSNSRTEKLPVVTSNASIDLFCSKEQQTKAELIWTLKTVQGNLAAGFSDDLKEVFPAMFPSPIPEKFSLGRTKLSYLITEALGPYFRKQLLADVGQSYYTILFDETTNNADKKELEFMIRFWSEDEKQVVCRHLQTVFIGHATADDIFREMKKVLNSCSLLSNKLLMLSSDGPNVNKKVWHLLNNYLIKETGQGLIDIGTCNLHVVNNAFLKGLQEFGDTACELVTDIFLYFKKFPSRWADYEASQVKVNVKQQRFLKHVSSRWLTAGPACERLLQQWPAVIEYFFKYVPNYEKKIMQTERYKRILKSLKYIDIKVELHFVLETSKLFSQFSEMFQRSEPLIHILYTQLKLILNTLKGRICKSDAKPDGVILIEHLIEVSKVDCGDACAAEIQLLSEKDRLGVMQKIQRHYMESHNYLVKKTVAEQKKLLICCQCLQPELIPQSRSINRISELARALSFVGIDALVVKDEWRILQTEVISTPNVRIDHFWRDIFSQMGVLGAPKYPALTKLVKAVLCLSHGNGDVERDFSVSKRVLTGEKSNMSERILNDRLLIKDSIKKYKTVANVPITKELLKLAYSAHKSHELYLEEQKKLKDQSEKEKREREDMLKKERLKQEVILEKKEDIRKLESRVKVVAKEKKETRESVDTLLKEANDRLKTAIQKKDLSGIRIAQVMLESAENLRQQEKDHESKESNLNRIVHKRKSNLIESYIIKKPKCT